MTRKDEIIEASHNNHNYPCSIITMEIHDPMIFQIGAEWADKTMIKKACNYLLDYIKNFDFYTESDVETFRKAMEE